MFLLNDRRGSHCPATGLVPGAVCGGPRRSRPGRGFTVHRAFGPPAPSARSLAVTSWSPTPCPRPPPGLRAPQHLGCPAPPSVAASQGLPTSTKRRRTKHQKVSIRRSSGGVCGRNCRPQPRPVQGACRAACGWPSSPEPCWPCTPRCTWRRRLHALGGWLGTDSGVRPPGFQSQLHPAPAP